MDDVLHSTRNKTHSQTRRYLQNDSGVECKQIKNTKKCARTTVYKPLRWFILSNVRENLIFIRSFHTTPEEFVNTALFLRLGLPSTIIRHQNGAFRKRSSNRKNLKTLALRFVWTENNLKTELSGNDDVTIIT